MCLLFLLLFWFRNIIFLLFRLSSIFVDLSSSEIWMKTHTYSLTLSFFLALAHTYGFRVTISVGSTKNKWFDDYMWNNKMWNTERHTLTPYVHVSIVAERPVETTVLSKYSTDCSLACFLFACSRPFYRFLVLSLFLLCCFGFGIAMQAISAKKRPFRRRCGELRCVME